MLLSVPAVVATLAAAFYAPAYAERAVQRRREERDFRQAQRLVAEELGRVSGDLRFTSERSVSFPPEAVGFLSTHEWEAHKAALARLLPGQMWSELVSVYTAVIRVRYALASGPGQRLDADTPEVLSMLAKRCDAVQAKLETAQPEL